MEVDEFFWNYFPRSVIIFGVGNSSSSHFDKNNFLTLGEGPTDGINRTFGSPEKRFSINCTKENTNFVWVYFMMLIIVICLLIEKKPLNLKPPIKVLTLQLRLVSEVFLMDLVIVSQQKCL